MKDEGMGKVARASCLRDEREMRAGEWGNGGMGG